MNHHAAENDDSFTFNCGAQEEARQSVLADDLL